jgi:hypothetical protein
MYLIPALLLIAPLATAQARDIEGCDNVNFTHGSRTSISSHSDSDDDYSVIDFVKVTDDRCTSATIVGKLQFTPAEDDILSMPFGSHAVFRERTPSSDRALSISRGSDGQLIRSYRYNGQNASYDADGQRWFASFLPHVLAEAGVNVKPRVARWRSQGGVDNVLSNIASLASSGSKRAHYGALLDEGRLSDDELDRVVRSASENLRSSSGDLRAVLTRAAPNVKLSKRSAVALEEALISMGSSGDKAAVAQLYGQTNDRDMLLAMMRVAQTIASSGDKSRLLQLLAPRYLAGKDRDLHDAYFAVAQQIPSSGDMRNVLHIAIPYGAGSPDIAQKIIETARIIPSSGDRSAVLVSLVTSGALQTKELRDAFFSAAAEVPSEGDRSRVLQAAASARP